MGSAHPCRGGPWLTVLVLIVAAGALGQPADHDLHSTGFAADSHALAVRSRKTGSLTLSEFLLSLVLSTVVFWGVEVEKWLMQRGEERA